MKKMGRAFLLMTALPAVAFAQMDQDYIMDDPVIIEEEVELTESNNGSNNKQPIIIYNKNHPSSEANAVNSNRFSQDVGQAVNQEQEVAVVQQPKTLIQANPIQDSQADEMRRRRQDMELQTELKIVEKLEESRIKDERRRARSLFGDRLNDDHYDDEHGPRHVPQQQHQAPIVIAAPVQEHRPSKDEIRDEIRAAVSELKTTAPVEEVQSDYYVGLGVGFSEYPDVINVRSDLNMGLSIGVDRKRLRTEGYFNYGHFEIENVLTDPFAPQITGVDQYIIGASAKYLIGNGVLKPYIGAGAAYSYRDYKDKQYFNVQQTGSSHALDVSPIVGLDVQMSKELALVAEFKYFINVYNRVNSNQGQFRQSFVNRLPTFGTPLEELDYYLLSFSARYQFD